MNGHEVPAIENGGLGLSRPQFAFIFRLSGGQSVGTSRAYDALQIVDHTVDFFRIEAESAQQPTFRPSATQIDCASAGR